MPELPEVESARRLVHSTCLNVRISEVNVLEQGRGPRHGLFDELVCAAAQEEFKTALLNNTIISAKRRGKQLFFELGKKGLHLLFHFGMSGSFAIEGMEVPSYVNVKIDTNYPPKYTKFEIVFENGRKLSFSDPRRLGRVKLLSGDPLTQLPLSKLARDPLIEGVGSDFHLRLSQYSMPVKAALLDQEAIICGMGNYLCDEVLYQSGIDPRVACKKIPTYKAEELAKCIEQVLKVACELTAANKDFPKHWLFNYRWGKGKKGSSMPDGNPITFDTVGGRTTAIVCKVQKATFGNSTEVATEDDDIKPKTKSKSKAQTNKVKTETETEIKTETNIDTKAMAKTKKVKRETETKENPKRRKV